MGKYLAWMNFFNYLIDTLLIYYLLTMAQNITGSNYSEGNQIVTIEGQLLDFARFIIVKDGAGWGFCLAMALLLAAIWGVGKKIDVVKMAKDATRFMVETQFMLKTIVGDRAEDRARIEEAINRLDRIESLNEKHHLGLSGDLSETKRKLDETIAKVADK
jgi:hypothetical protein